MIFYAVAASKNVYVSVSRFLDYLVESLVAFEIIGNSDVSVQTENSVYARVSKIAVYDKRPTLLFTQIYRKICRHGGFTLSAYGRLNLIDFMFRANSVVNNRI